MRREMNILAMAKGCERYIFLYDDQSYDSLIGLFDKFAANPDLNFSSADANLMGQKARESRARASGSNHPSTRMI